MHPFSNSTDEDVPLKFIMTKSFITTNHRNIHWNMYKYLKISNTWIYLCFQLPALNVPLQIGKCTQGWKPLIYTISTIPIGTFHHLSWQKLLDTVRMLGDLSNKSSPKTFCWGWKFAFPPKKTFQSRLPHFEKLSQTTGFDYISSLDVPCTSPKRQQQGIVLCNIWMSQW